MHRILVVEDDPYFSGVLVEVLKAEGFSVILRDRADSALVAARRRSPELLLISQELPDRSGLELIKELRRSDAGREVPIILMFGVESTRLRGSPESLGVSELLAKPFSVLNLPDRVRRLLAPEEDSSSEPTPCFSVPTELAELDDSASEPAPVGGPELPADAEETEELHPATARRAPIAPGRSPAASPRLRFEPPPGALPDLNSLRTITQAWAQKKDGVLRIVGSSDWVTFSAGEPLDEREARLAEEALYRPGASFQELSHTPGDAGLSIAEALLEAGRRAADVRCVTNSLDRSLLTDRAGEAAFRLPIDPALARLIYEVDSRRSLGAICADEHLAVQDIAPDLAALLAMGLVRFGPFRRPKPSRPAPPPPRRPRRQPPRPSGSRVRSPGDWSGALSASRSTSHSADGPRPSSRSRSLSRTSSSETVYEHPGVSDPSVTTRSLASAAGRGGRPTGGRVRHRMKIAASLRRLRKEAERLEGASDWTVLSLPAGAPPEMVEQAGKRMLARYSAEAARPDMPEEGRLAAARLLTLVGEALDRIREGRPREAEDPAAGKTDVEILLDQGARAAEDGRWDRAVQCFTAARNQRLDDPRTLAWLGWSIYKQAKKDGYAEEALELLQLADSFDPTLSQGQYFLAVLEAETGRDSDAFERLQLLLMNDPGHAEARALFKELDAQRRAARD